VILTAALAQASTPVATPGKTLVVSVVTANGFAPQPVLLIRALVDAVLAQGTADGALAIAGVLITPGRFVVIELSKGVLVGTDRATTKVLTSSEGGAVLTGTDRETTKVLTESDSGAVLVGANRLA
jgi:hypothetical protein